MATRQLLGQTEVGLPTQLVKINEEGLNNGPFSSIERSQGCCLQTTNEGQRNMPPPPEHTGIVPLYWLLLLFMPHATDAQKRIVKEDEICAKTDADNYWSCGTVPSENGNSRKRGQGKGICMCRSLLEKGPL